MPRPVVGAAAAVPVINFEPRGILALDLARVTGWTYGHIGDRFPRFGTWKLIDPIEGGRFAAFENALIEAMERMQPAKLVLEAPLPLPGQTSLMIAAQQLTLRGIARMEAWRNCVAVSEVDAGTVRYDVLGQRYFAKGTVKREAMAFCWRRGWKVPDHNAADAALLWLWFTRRLDGVRPAAGPLFAETLQ